MVSVVLAFLDSFLRVVSGGLVNLSMMFETEALQVLIIECKSLHIFHSVGRFDGNYMVNAVGRPDVTAWDACRNTVCYALFA